MEYKPNGKGAVAPVEYNPIVSTPIEKARFYEKIVFRIGNHHGKRLKKCSIKDKM